MQTDTEVIAYAVDLLVRKHNLPVELIAKVFAPPFWSDIERQPEGKKKLLSTLRQVYSSLLLNGPFSVIIAHHGEMIGLTDRIRLRPLTVGEKGDMLFISSEESAIRLICPELDKVWTPMGGEPVIGKLKERTPLQPAVIGGTV
jgi:glutamate synthase domain-containing protein 1